MISSRSWRSRTVHDQIPRRGSVVLHGPLSAWPSSRQVTCITPMPGPISLNDASCTCIVLFLNMSAWLAACLSSISARPRHHAPATLTKSASVAKQAAKRTMSWLFHAASTSATSASASFRFTAAIVGQPGRDPPSSTSHSPRSRPALMVKATSGPWPDSPSARHSVEAPFAGDAFEFVQAAVLERHAGAGDEVFDGAGDEHFPGLCV